MCRVLTIDFDIVMAPTINLYNDLVGDNKGINAIIKKYPTLEQALIADFFIYAVLLQELTRHFKYIPADKVHFIKEHHSIVPIIEKIDAPVDLVNIDFHHDTGYGISTYTRIERPDCGNWVKYLKDKGLLRSYVWVNDIEGSEMPFVKGIVDFTVPIQQCKFHNFEPFDHLVICHSPQWIPQIYEGLYIGWFNIATEHYGKTFTEE